MYYSILYRSRSSGRHAGGGSSTDRRSFEQGPATTIQKSPGDFATLGFGKKGRGGTPPCSSYQRLSKIWGEKRGPILKPGLRGSAKKTSQIWICDETPQKHPKKPLILRFFGHFLPFFGHFWPFLAIFGHFWPFLTPPAPRLRSMTPLKPASRSLEQVNSSHISKYGHIHVDKTEK